LVASHGSEAAATGLRIRKLGVLGAFVVSGIRLYPSGGWLVFRIHENISKFWIGCRSTPVGPAGHAWKDYCRWTAIRLVEPRCIRTFIAELRLVPQFLACKCMFGSGVFRSDKILFGHADSGYRPWFHGNRLGGRIPFSRNVAFCHRTLYHAVHRLTGFAI